ncbi:hypothetical protein HJG60_011523 [Phyllostomus discolor]|uniref:Uncharacterized protein n=1 Tax=Phyllostomus discolor TaxID=89673 RepID=A0A834E0U8_9CHIR|nr:hypothetical protein HJG60_011523 [Phyllostomus discolor]
MVISFLCFWCFLNTDFVLCKPFSPGKVLPLYTDSVIMASVKHDQGREGGLLSCCCQHRMMPFPVRHHQMVYIRKRLRTCRELFLENPVITREDITRVSIQSLSFSREEFCGRGCYTGWAPPLW